MGAVKIISETGIAAGVRRIEAITGIGLYDYIAEDDALNLRISEKLKTPAANIVNRVSALTEEVKALKRAGRTQASVYGRFRGDLVKNAKEINGVKLITAKFENTDIVDLRSLSDQLKAEAKRRRQCPGGGKRRQGDIPRFGVRLPPGKRISRRKYD